MWHLWQVKWRCLHRAMLVSVSISLKPQQKHRKNILRVSTSLLCFTVHLTSVNSDSKRLHWVVKQHAGWIGLRLSHFPITHMKHVKPSEMDVESFWGESDTYVWPQTWKESGWRRRRVRNGRKAAPEGPASPVRDWSVGVSVQLLPTRRRHSNPATSKWRKRSSHGSVNNRGRLSPIRPTAETCPLNHRLMLTLDTWTSHTVQRLDNCVFRLTDDTWRPQMNLRVRKSQLEMIFIAWCFLWVKYTLCINLRCISWWSGHVL